MGTCRVAASLGCSGASSVWWFSCKYIDFFTPHFNSHHFFFAVYLHFNRFYSSISERIKT